MSYITFEFYNSLYYIGSCAYQINISQRLREFDGIGLFKFELMTRIVFG